MMGGFEFGSNDFAKLLRAVITPALSLDASPLTIKYSMYEYQVNIDLKSLGIITS